MPFAVSIVFPKTQKIDSVRPGPRNTALYYLRFICRYGDDCLDPVVLKSSTRQDR